jgi:hypothetical protein
MDLEHRLEKNLKWPPTEEGEEKRYGIVDKTLHELLSYCIGMFGFSEDIINHIWSYERDQNSEEIEWYRYIYGEYYAKRYFIRINEERNRLEGIIGKTSKERERAKSTAYADYKTYSEAGNFQSPKYKHANEILKHFAGIEQTDRIKSLSHHWYQKLTSEEYRDVYAKYSIIIDALMNIAYPPFMKNIFQPM